MNDRQQCIEEIFLAALELPDAGQRSAFLERHCAGNLALRPEVERYLVVHAKVEYFFAETHLLLNDTARLAS